MPAIHQNREAPMPQIIVTIGPAGVENEDGERIPVLDLRNSVVEEVTSSGTSQATTISAKQRGYVARVTNNGSGAADAVWVKFAASGSVAVADVGSTMVLAGQSADLGGMRRGDKVLVIDDS